MANLENNFFNVGKGNKKTGVMLTTRSPRNTCPDDCGLKSNGCYAENAPIVWWWDKQDKTEKDMLDAIRRVPKNHLWRHNEAGDFVSRRVNQNGGWNFKQPFWIPHFPPRSCPETNDRRFFANHHLRPVLSFVTVNAHHVASSAFAAFSQNVY